MGINRGRVWLGGLAGGVVWVIWSFAVTFLVVGMPRYQEAQNTGQFLKDPRYPGFELQWVVTLVISAIIMAHLYAWVRSTLGAGPKTALKLGFMVGFVAGFPLNFATAAFSPINRIFPFGWMLEMWAGTILATLVAGALYKE